MKIRVLANELLDSDISFVSLVKNGAIRSPFKILKAEEAEMVRQRNARREQQLAARRSPVRRNTFAELRKASQRAADVGCAFLKDTDEMDPQEGRHGADTLRADTPASRTEAENDAALGRHFREIVAMLRRVGQEDAAKALEQAIRSIEASGSVTKAEQDLLFSIANRFRGGSLDWLEAEGERMVARNEALLRDVGLSSLDESLGTRNDNAGIEKADGDRVLDSAFDAGMGISGKYR